MSPVLRGKYLSNPSTPVMRGAVVADCLPPVPGVVPGAVTLFTALLGVTSTIPYLFNSPELQKHQAPHKKKCESHWVHRPVAEAEAGAGAAEQTKQDNRGSRGTHMSAGGGGCRNSNNT